MSDRNGDDPEEPVAAPDAEPGDALPDEAADGADPFADLGDGPADPEDVFDRLGEPVDGDPFTEMDVDALPEEEAWDDADGVAGGSGVVPEIQEPAPEVGVRTREKEAIVAKRCYCESCEYFSEPPDVSCTHAGTEIRQLVDVDHFKVHACPVVAKRRNIRYDDDE